MVNYSRISPEAGMVMKKGSGDYLPSGRVPGRAQISPRRWRQLRTSFWDFLAIFRVFHPGGINRRSGGVGADLGGPHLCQARPARLGRAWARCGPPVAPLLLPFGHLESSGVKLRKIVSFSNFFFFYKKKIFFFYYKKKKKKKKKSAPPFFFFEKGGGKKKKKKTKKK